jgi:hypothetical protein
VLQDVDGLPHNTGVNMGLWSSQTLAHEGPWTAWPGLGWTLSFASGTCSSGFNCRADLPPVWGLRA